MDDNNYCIEKLGSVGRYQIKLEDRFLDELEDAGPDEIDELEPDPLDTPEEKLRKKLVREQKKEALHRQEEAARSEDDFWAIIKKWDNNDATRERRERYNEMLRGDVPIDYGCSYSPDLKIFPKYLNTTAERQLAKGYFLDFIYDCPEDIYKLTSIKYASKIIYDLDPKHKELLYFLGVKNFKIRHFAEMRGTSERNIRREQAVVYKKVWKQVYKVLDRRKKRGRKLTSQEMEFMRGYENGTLVMRNGEKRI